VRGANRMFMDTQVIHSKQWEQCSRLGDTLDNHRVFLLIDAKNGIRLHGTFERGDTIATGRHCVTSHANAVYAYMKSKTANIHPTARTGMFQFDKLDATVRFTHVSIDVPGDETAEIGFGYDRVRKQRYSVETINEFHIQKYGTVYYLGDHISWLNFVFGAEDNNSDDRLESGWKFIVPLTRPQDKDYGRILSVPCRVMQDIPVSENLLTRGQFSVYKDGTYDAWPRGTTENIVHIDSYDEARFRDEHLTSRDPVTHSLYHTLGLERNATPDEINKAYKTKALKTHPDKPGGTSDTFKEVKRASRVLMDVDTRRKYDAQGDWVRFKGTAIESPRFKSMMSNPYFV